MNVRAIPFWAVALVITLAWLALVLWGDLA